jgi:hypothetical protein
MGAVPDHCDIARFAGNRVQKQMIARRPTGVEERTFPGFGLAQLETFG